jgi:uncharacterized cupin superfamily protein
VHHLKRRETISLSPAYESRSKGFTRCALVDADAGSVHMGVGLSRLEEGHVDTHVHSFEESFYVLEGEPVLYLDGSGIRLARGACGVVPVGDRLRIAERILLRGRHLVNRQVAVVRRGTSCADALSRPIQIV